MSGLVTTCTSARRRPGRPEGAGATANVTAPPSTELL